MVIGLTGKICSGKNHIAGLLERRGLQVMDLDREAERIRLALSGDIFKTFGTVSKAELAAAVFSDSAKLEKLENMIYPVLREKIENFSGNLVINGALIRRAGFDRLCSFIIFVDAPFDVRLERALKQRKMEKADFTGRDENQQDVSPDPALYCCPVHVIRNAGRKDADLISDLDRIFSLRQQS